MAEWHHWLDGQEFEQAPGVGDGQWGLACCSPFKACLQSWDWILRPRLVWGRELRFPLSLFKGCQASCGALHGSWALCTKILPPWFPYSGKQRDTERPHFPARKTEGLLLIRYEKNHSVCWCCVDRHRLSKHSLGQWHIFIVKLRVTHWPYKGYQSLILQGVLPRETDRLHDRT